MVKDHGSWPDYNVSIIKGGFYAGISGYDDGD